MNRVEMDVHLTCSSNLNWHAYYKMYIYAAHYLFKITSNDARVLFITFHKNLLHSSSDQPLNI